MTSLNILQHNVLSWHTRNMELQNVYRSLNPHLILINAHGLKEQEELKIFNYYIFKNNITNSLHDGAALAIRRDLRSRRVEGLTEILAVKITLAHEEIVVATGYTPFRRVAIPIQDFLTF